jgi:uroporphyrinogen-III synthase
MGRNPHNPPSPTPCWHGRVVVITRPAGTASALARQVRALGGVPLLLPGLSLRAAADREAARAALDRALRDELLLFTSPAAVRFAAALRPLATRAQVFAVGQGTAAALRRHGLDAQAPRRQDSEGLLDLPALREPRGRSVALVGAAGGRGLLRERLVARGAQLREVHVYARVAPRLDRRHLEPLLRLPPDARVLLSSGEALDNLRAILPPPAWSRLRAAVAVASSERLAALARAAGFAEVRVAASAQADAMLAATA